MFICWSGITNSTQPIHHLGTQGRWLSGTFIPQIQDKQQLLYHSLPGSHPRKVCTGSWDFMSMGSFKPSKLVNWGPKIHPPFVGRCPTTGSPHLVATPLSLSWQENSSRTSTFWQIRPNCPSASSGITYYMMIPMTIWLCFWDGLIVQFSLKSKPSGKGHISGIF